MAAILPRMTTTVLRKGQMALPAKIRQRDDVKSGEQFEVERIARGKYRLKRKERRRNEGLLEWLLRCPEKGWFRPWRFTETTEDINFPKFE